MSYKAKLKKVWKFIWYDDSFASLIVNILIAFVLIKFVVYPGVGYLMGTSMPIVAVVSSSMHHDASFENWWANAKPWYEANGVSYENFSDFSLRNGFNKGDIMFIKGVSIETLDVGDVIVYDSSRPYPIIHRIVGKYIENGQNFYITKGDNYQTNPGPLQSIMLDETRIPFEIIQGKAVFRVPFVGYVKIFAMQIGSIFG